MKNSLILHCSYFLITLGTFVAGSQFARSSAGSAEEGGTRQNSIKKIRVRDGQILSALPRTEKREQAPAAAPIDGALGHAGRSRIPRIGGVSIDRFSTEGGPLDQQQIEELVLLALKSSDPVERRKAFDRLLQEMGSDTFTVEQAMTMRHMMHENGAGGEQWRLFDYAWGANDPSAAIAYIDQIPEQYRKGYTGNMLPGLASADPQAAIALVAAMEGQLQREMTGRLLEGLVDNDPAIATNYLMGLAENGDPNAGGYMRRLAKEILENHGLERGRQWAESLADGQLQGAALVPIANEYANNDPHGAATWAQQFVGEDQNSRMFGEIVREWGDWQQASAWVDSLEPGLAQNDGISAVYGFRGATEPEVAVQDIINMSASDEKNFAINGFISGLAHQDGETAVIWAAEITSPGMREEAMVRAGKQFYEQDQQAATEWFDSSGLPEDRWEQMIGQ